MKRCVCLVLAALLLAACGGSENARLSKAGYEAKLRTTFSSASTGIRAPPHPSGRVLLKRIAKSYEEIASSLKGLRVPADAQPLNDRLAAAAAEKAAGLQRLVRRLNSASPSERQQLLAEYDLNLADFDAAVAALEAKGYRFRPSAGR